jgi:hypothetical protein
VGAIPEPEALQPFAPGQCMHCLLVNLAERAVTGLLQVAQSQL